MSLTSQSALWLGGCSVVTGGTLFVSSCLSLPEASGMTSEEGHATVVNAVNMQSFLQTIEVLMTPFIMGIS